MKEEWEQMFTAEQPLFKQHCQCERLVKHRDKIGNVASKYLVYSEKGTVRAFLTKKHYTLIQENGKKLLDKNIAMQTIEEIKQAIASFQNAETNLRSLLVENSPSHGKEFVENYQKFDTELLKIFAYLLTTWEATVHYTEEELRQKLASEEKFITLTTPTEPDLLLREKMSLLEVARSPTEEKIKKHTLDYALLYCNIDSEKEAFQLAETKLNAVSIPELQKEIENSLAKLEKTKAKQRQILKEVNSEDVESLAFTLQQFSLLRLELKACWQGVHYYLFPLFEQIAAETSSTIRDVMMFWTSSEILNFLQNSIAPRKGEVEERADFYLLLLSDGKIQFYTGEKARKVKDEVFEELSTAHLTEFKGAIANLGIVRGVVKLLKTDDLRLAGKNLSEMKENSVLVVGMTNPNMVQIARKAIAIVTDEGGVTCHAAIISREFNIPCIIGTKIATQVLKDGDEVEVDANAGVIRILKRNSGPSEI